jgi:hypothetical protein
MADRAHVHEWGTRVIGSLEIDTCECGGRRTRVDLRRLSLSTTAAVRAGPES